MSDEAKDLADELQRLLDQLYGKLPSDGCDWKKLVVAMTNNTDAIIAALRDRKNRDAEIAGLRAALKSALEHVQELRDAWQTGALSERDGLGGTRSNRNVAVEVKILDALRGSNREDGT